MRRVLKTMGTTKMRLTRDPRHFSPFPPFPLSHLPFPVSRLPSPFSFFPVPLSFPDRTGPSSNGRTSDFGSENGGSNPPGPIGLSNSVGRFVGQVPPFPEQWIVIRALAVSLATLPAAAPSAPSVGGAASDGTSGTLIGIPQRANGHTLRHSFPTRLLGSRVHIRTGKGLLGHQGLGTTTVTQVLLNDARDLRGRAK